MKIAADLLLLIAVLCAWFASFAFLRLATPLARIHAVTFLNVTLLGGIVGAGLLSRGATPQTLKCVLIWFATVTIGALLSHATGRAYHLRGGERL